MIYSVILAPTIPSNFWENWISVNRPYRLLEMHVKNRDIFNNTKGGGEGGNTNLLELLFRIVFAFPKAKKTSEREYKNR